MKKVLYICDGNKPECKKRICFKNKSKGCRHTTDIEHAINFKKYEENGSFWEKEAHQGKREEDGNINSDTITSNDFEYEVTKYPMFDRAVVSFQLPYHGWKTLENSHFLRAAMQYLSEIQKGQNQR